MKDMPGDGRRPERVAEAFYVNSQPCSIAI